MFTARPPQAQAPRRTFPLLAARRQAFTGQAEFLADPGNRARVAEYLADLARPYELEVRPELLGHSFGEMAEPLIAGLGSADEPVDLLILAFSVHDLRPGRQTAAYLSHLTPGSPMAFAICDQGSAAAFTGLRIAREYAVSAGVRRALLVVVEQAGLPYDCSAPVPLQHQGIAMLFGEGQMPLAQVTEVCQHAGVPPDQAPELAAKELARLAAGHEQAMLVLGDSLAPALPAFADWPVRTVPAGQPMTGLWWSIVGELGAEAAGPLVVVAADYDPGLGYLCLTVFEQEGSAEWETR